MCNLGNEWVIRVRVCQHGADAQQHFSFLLVLYALTNRTVQYLTLGDGESRAPLVSQNIQADASVRVDIGVVDASGEVDLRGLEGIVGWEVDC